MLWAFGLSWWKMPKILVMTVTIDHYQISFKVEICMYGITDWAELN
jgi:hypothetical protein